MIKIAICDDEITTVEDLKNRLTSYFQNKQKYYCFSTSNPTELLKHTEQEHVDILLLDIDMPELSGFDIAKQMASKDKNPILIFITSMDTLVYEAIKFKPFRFIRKSQLEQEFEEAIDSALQALERQTDVFTANFNNKSSIDIPLHKIVYFESAHNDVNIVMTDTIQRCRNTLEKIEKELSPKGFARTHSGFVVNLQYVHTIGLNIVNIQTDKITLTLPLSRNRKEFVKEQLRKSMR